MCNKNIRFIGLLLFFSFFAASFGCGGEGQSGALPENGLLINEAATSNKNSLIDPTYGSPDWIELYNGSDTPVSLNGYSITDELSNANKLCPLPDIVLSPGGYLVLFANDKEGDNCLAFSLSKAGETLTIVNRHQEEVCSLVIPALIQDVSYARRSDGTYGYCALPTPGEENTYEILNELPAISALDKDAALGGPRSADIFITEAVSRNVSTVSCEGCSECGDWIELYNPNDEAVELSGFTLCDDPKDYNKANIGAFTIPAKGYLLVRCCQPGCALASEHCCIQLGISRYGDTVYLYDANGNLLDSVAVPELDKDVSWAKRSDNTWGYCAYPTPGIVNADSAVLDTYSAEAGNAPAPLSGPVLINELLPGNKYSIADGDGDRSDFVELYNSGTTSVSLLGWYLSDEEDNPDKWAFPDVSIGPGEYLVVFLSGKDRADEELHASFSLSEGETMVLYDSLHNAVDTIAIPVVPQNVSIGRDGIGALVYYAAPSPGNKNGHAFTSVPNP